MPFHEPLFHALGAGPDSGGLEEGVMNQGAVFVCSNALPTVSRAERAATLGLL